MAKPVLDPALLAQLNAPEPKKVADPVLLAQLNGEQAPPEDESWLTAAKNVGEAGLHLGTSMVGGAAGDVAGLAALLSPAAMIARAHGKNIDPSEIRDKVRESLTYHPGNPDSTANKLVTLPGRVISGAGDYLAEKTGADQVPYLDGVVRAIPLVAATALGAKGSAAKAGNAEVAATVKNFEDAGTTPSVGQATQGRVARAVETLASRLPGGAGRMAEKATKQAEEVGAKVDEMATSLSSKTDAERAGRAIEKGVSGEGGFVEGFRKKRNELYDALDKHIHKDTRIPVSNTKEALAGINGKVPGAPNTSELFANKRTTSIETALDKDLSIPTEATQRLDKAVAKIDELYKSRDAARQEQGRFMEKEAFAAGRVNNYSPVPGLPRAPGKYTPFEGRRGEAASAAQDADHIASMRGREARDLESAVAELHEAAEASKGKLPYQAVKQLRTLVGRELDNPSLVSDVPRAQWSTLYRGLSDDMKAAATSAGPGAKLAWDRANRYNLVGNKRIEVLEDVVQRAGGPEAIFSAATSGAREGATTLHTVMKSLPADAQKAVSASVLRRMGRAKPGAQNDVGNVFSMESFLTNWNNLSPRAKSVLFDRYGDKFTAQINSVAKVASNLRDGSKVFRNPSGTSQAEAQIAAASTVITGLITGHPEVAAGVGATAAAANLAARRMTNMKNVRKIAEGRPGFKAPATAAAAATVQTAEEKKRQRQADALRSN